MKRTEQYDGARRNDNPKLLFRRVKWVRMNRDVTVLPAKAERLSRFEFERYRDALKAEHPSWPTRTEDLSQISVSMVIDATGLVRSRLGARRITLDILDYPGEWLLDLPMLSKSFGQWSTETLARLRRSEVADAFRPFLEYTESLDPAGRVAEQVIKRGWELYRTGLVTVRERARYLQPGRFICPGPDGDQRPYLWFWPMKGAVGAGTNGTNLKLLNQRYEAYCREVRESFVKPYLSRFDRQILLVDLLGALWAGEAAFTDTQEALRDIGEALRAHKFSRIAAIATKVDLLPPMKRDHLQRLLEVSLQQTLGKNSGVSYHTASAVSATQDVNARREGTDIEAVSGVRMEDGRTVIFDSGDIPSKEPSAQFWRNAPLIAPVFVPPRQTLGVRHRNLDEVLVAVLGDLL
jgi:uncharacterized protein